MAGYIRNRREAPGSKEGALFIRGQDGGLILSNDLAHELKNMHTADEGTLRSVWGPAVYVPLKKNLALTGPSDVTLRGGTQPPSALNFQGVASSVASVVIPELASPDNYTPVYGKRQHGIHHATLQNGERDVLLLHTGAELWEFRGWGRDWRRLISVPAGPHGVKGTLRDDDASRFPTQFETVGNGVVIVPQDSRAYFYDGEIIAPLGFSEKPASPTPLGPDNSTGLNDAISGDDNDEVLGINDTGYAHSGLWACKEKFNPSGMEYGFGLCRVGTTNPYLTGVDGSVFEDGLIDPGEWRCRAQYIDVFGNLSAPSDPSDPATTSRQGTMVKLSGKAAFIDAKGKKKPMAVENTKLQLAWTGIPTGPEHCIARMLYRTKDLVNSGDAKYYALPQNASATLSALATLNDNVCTIYPDNMADGFLGAELLDVVPVPQFRLCRSAFGRLFIGNLLSDEGKIMFSQPGAWGTFKRGDVIFPDASGGEITGMWRCTKGLLAFTSTSTFLINAGSGPDDFSVAPISQEIGCEAPNSIQTLEDGRVIWLGRSGFYSFDGTQIASESSALRRLFKRLTVARFRQACSAFDPTSGEYRCWVSSNGSTENDLCLIMRSNKWRTRTDVLPRDVCVTDDPRGYMLAAGSVSDDAANRDGVYLLDHAVSPLDTNLRAATDSREALIETVWLQGYESKKKETIPSVFLWFRESDTSSVSVEVMRDWREDIVETVETARFSTVDRPPVWGDAVLGGLDDKFRRRRPYWNRVQIYLPSSEVFKLRIRGTGFWEFIGLSFDMSPRTFGNAQLPG